MEINKASSISGEITIPGDKSVSHRSVMISSLTHQQVRIRNFLFSQDCINTVEALIKTGVEIEKIPGGLIVHGKGLEGLREPSCVINTGNSGTTIRLLSGILAGTGFMSVLEGDSSINSRPMARIIKPLRVMGAEIYGRAENTKAPLVIFGRRLKGASFKTEVASAQVKSCLLLAGLHADGEVLVSQPGQSRDHTERMLEYFGADITYDGKNAKISPGKILTGNELYIPGDVSSAAYFIVACLVLDDSHIIIKDSGVNPSRIYFIELLRQMGGDIRLINPRNFNNEPVADIEVRSSSLKATSIEEKDIANIIDEIPVLCVAAAFAEGETVIRGASELRFKESDRIRAISEQFRKAGVDLEEREDGIKIAGKPGFEPAGGRFESYGDHRIAMSLAILGLKSKKAFSIPDSGCIDTSFPGFEKTLKNSLITR